MKNNLFLSIIQNLCVEQKMRNSATITYSEGEKINKHEKVKTKCITNLNNVF